MSNDKTNEFGVPNNAGGKPAPAATTTVEPTRIPPLFRKVDWIAFTIATLLVFIGYFLTLAPDVTLEDSGELATGSFYAGVPHPPGYPVWSIVTYFFANFLPVANVAYRVAVASALAGALAAGLLGLLVSRGSSMILDGIAEFKDLPRRTENWICAVSGISSALMLAFNGYMWSQSVIVEVYPLSVLSLMVVCCLILRWMYAPTQRRYIYWAWFVFGICFTNHQTLIVAAMGVEIAIIAADFKLGRDLLLGNSACFIVGLFAFHFKWLGSFEPSDMVYYLFVMIGILSVVGCVWLSILTKGLGNRMWPVLAMFGLWLLGAAFYFYMPITSTTNPPMNWGYARTVDGFIHAFTRGQYEKTNPTNFFTEPGRLVTQLGMYVEWAQDEFNLVNLTLALVPLVFFLRMRKRERAWLIGLGGIWFCLAIILLILLNPGQDRASRDLNKVFFASSYTAIALYIGYGLSLIAASLVTNYKRFRLWSICGGVVAFTLALVTLYMVADSLSSRSTWETIRHSFAKDQYGLPVFGGMVLVALTLIYTLTNLLSRERIQIGIILFVFALLPANSIMSHWADNEEREHWFGYWFGHDMFTPPFNVYPQMTTNAVLFGGTDPGRFCPTYMIFCESFIPHDKQPAEDQHFDRRDVYIITQNALADPTYLEYIRAQYNRSTQIDPPFFQELFRGSKEKTLNYNTNIIARAAYDILDKPLLSFGAKVEARRRRELVYPPKEIYCPTADDSQNCFSEYMADAQQRLDHDLRYPNEPKQIKPGEDVHQIPGDNRVSVSGQVAVMSINGLLTKVIFDKNPTNEFFVEESFPLDWMYPYLSPFGVIMKINRNPIDIMSQEAVDKDHKFWTNYSTRLIGNWINYDTPVSEIGAFVEKVYDEKNYSGYKGDRKFIRDDQAQKAFSKLRSSIGGVYDWRFHHAKDATEQQRMLKEADFAFRQAFAFCPYSPEVVYRYINLLLSTGRIDDALIIVDTCHKLDSKNGQITGLREQLHSIKEHGPNGAPPQSAAPSSQPTAANLEQMEKDWHDHPTNYQAAFSLAGAYLQSQQREKGVAVLDQVLASPTIDPNAVVFLAQAYAQLGKYPQLERALERLTELKPDSPEAWCDLAAMKAAIGKNKDAIADLRRSLQENSKRLAADPKAANVRASIEKDQRFKSLENLPEYKQLLAGK